MGAVYRRQGSRFYWLKFHDSQGREQRRSSETADKKEACALLAEIEGQERAKAPRASLASLTVQVWYEGKWLPQRKVEQPSAWRTDDSRLRHHFLPEFGGWSLADLGTERGEQAVLDWLVGLRSHTAKRDGQPIAARTAWSTWSIVKVFFADARERRVIARSPCDGLRPRKHLPVKVDKVKGFRETAGFNLDQVVALTSDQRVPLDRRRPRLPRRWAPAELQGHRPLEGPRPDEGAALVPQHLGRLRLREPPGEAADQDGGHLPRPGPPGPPGDA